MYKYIGNTVRQTVLHRGAKLGFRARMQWIKRGRRAWQEMLSFRQYNEKYNAKE
jgi:hypothetical protein